MSQILNWLSTNLFKSKNPEHKTIKDQTNNSNDSNTVSTVDKTNKTDKTDLNTDEKEIKKWTPNDDLWRRYNKFLTVMADIHKKKHSESKLISQSKHLIQQYKAESVSDDITSKLNATQTKQQLMSIESELKKVQNALKQLESMDGKVLDEWNEYLELAREFLITNGLDEFIDVNEILCTTNLFVTIKKLFDSFYTKNTVDETRLEQIAKATLYFDTSKTQNHAMITNKEFEIKRKALLDKVKCAHIVDDLSKPFDNTILALPHNEVKSINNVLQISGPVHIDIPEARLVTNPNVITDLPIANTVEQIEPIESIKSNEPVIVLLP